MENDIASILFARGIMPDDFISYSTYAAVAEIVKENKALLAKVSEQEKEIARYKEAIDVALVILVKRCTEEEQRLCYEHLDNIRHENKTID